MSAEEIFAAACADSLDAVATFAMKLMDEGTIDDHIRILATLRDFKADIGQAYKDIDARIAEEVVECGGKLTVDGLGEVRAGWSSDSYEWDMAGYLDQVATRAMDEPAMVCDEEGNKLPVHVLAHNIAKRILECASFDYGRLKNAKDHGVDGYRYRHLKASKHRKVTLPGRKP